MKAVGLNNIFVDFKKDKKPHLLLCNSATILPPSDDLKKTPEQRLNISDASKDLNIFNRHVGNR